MNSILIIDDEEVNFIINSKILTLGKFADKVVYQSSGASGLKYLESLADKPQEWPTHIFVDINMPEMDGFEFIEAYKSITEKVSFKSKVFILSSSICEQDKKKAKELTIIDQYLVKPFTFQTAGMVFN